MIELIVCDRCKDLVPADDAGVTKVIGSKGTLYFCRKCIKKAKKEWEQRDRKQG